MFGVIKVEEMFKRRDRRKSDQDWELSEALLPVTEQKFPDSSRGVGRGSSQQLLNPSIQTRDLVLHAGSTVVWSCSVEGVKKSNVAETIALFSDWLQGTINNQYQNHCF